MSQGLEAVTTLTPTQAMPYDPVQDEPELEFTIRSRRTVNPQGKPCSRWEFSLKGEWGDAMPSQPQRDWASTMLRQVSFMVQEPMPQGVPQFVIWASIARRLWAEMKALMSGYTQLVAGVVVAAGPEKASLLLGRKQRDVIHLLKQRNPAALDPRATVPPETLQVAERRGELSGIAQAVIAERR